MWLASSSVGQRETRSDEGGDLPQHDLEGGRLHRESQKRGRQDDTAGPFGEDARHHGIERDEAAHAVPEHEPRHRARRAVGTFLGVGVHDLHEVVPIDVEAGDVATLAAGLSLAAMVGTENPRPDRLEVLCERGVSPDVLALAMRDHDHAAHFIGHPRLRTKRGAIRSLDLASLVLHGGAPRLHRFEDSSPQRSFDEHGPSPLARNARPWRRERRAALPAAVRGTERFPYVDMKRIA